MSLICDVNNIFEKTPTGELDYTFDWASYTNQGLFEDWLESGEEITSFTVTVPAGLTELQSGLTNNNTSVTLWVSGGTLGETYTIPCSIVTNSSPENRKDTRSIIINIVAK